MVALGSTKYKTEKCSVSINRAIKSNPAETTTSLWMRLDTPNIKKIVMTGRTTRYNQ